MTTASCQQLSAADLKDTAHELGADLVGIAGIDRFRGLPPEHDPKQIFPDARSAIVLGRRIPRGALRGVEEGTQFGIYSLYGDDWLSTRFLAFLTYEVSEYIENSGYEAVPLPDLPPEIPSMGIPVAEGKPAPNVLVDMADAAVRAGLGEIDPAGFFISPEFGPRQRLQAILTDAELEPDPVVMAQINDCPPETYATFCPLGAIDTANISTTEICGRIIRRAAIDTAKCRTCRNGASASRFHERANPDRLAALCARGAVDYLDRKKRLTVSFANPFRQRPAWSVVGDRRYLEKGSEIE